MNHPLFQVILAKQYKKDIKRLVRSGFNLRPLERAIEILANGELLPTEYRDHALRGNMQDARECHIGPDWLLVYERDDERLILFLLRTGDHRRALGIE